MLKNAHIFVFLLIIAIIHCTPVPLTFGIVQSSYVDTSSEIEYSIQYNSSNYISVSAFALASYNSTYDITFCVGTEPNPTPTQPNSLIGCTSDGEESIIVPPQASSTIYVAIGTKSPTPLMFSVSSSLILDALSSDYQVSAGKYYITGTVSSGMRQYYMYKPTSSDQQIQIEVCSSVDLKGNNNAIRGAVLFNRTSDLWTVYNQTYADYPCGTPGTNGNIKVFDPSSDNYNSYLQICPTYIVTKGPITDDTFIGIDILRFWSFPQLNGTLNYRINIDTTYSTYLPLHPAAKGNPDYVYTANFSIAQSSDSAVVSFEVVSSTSGPPITDIQYALFSDYSLSSQVKQYIQSNSSMASSCFLIGHESSMMVSSWVTSDQLVAGSGSLATFTIDDFYDEYEGTFDINLVAYSPTHGSFAYTYQSINSSESDDGMGFWSWFFIVVGSILGLLAILLVLGVIGYFAYMKYRNRSKYELL